MLNFNHTFSLESIHKNIKFAFCLILSFVLIGCTSQSIELEAIEARTASDKTSQMNKEQLNIIKKSKQLHAEFIKKGLLWDKAASNAYLNKIATHILTTAKLPTDSYRFYIIRNAIPNAFTTGAGNIYIHTGLLALLENEAQFAYLLSHEIAHVENEDALRSYYALNNAKDSEFILGLVVGGLGSAISYAGFFEFSRAQEEKADIDAFTWILKTDYDINEAPKLFSQMRTIDNSGPSIYSSHPQLIARENYVKDLVTANAEHGGTKIAKDNFNGLKQLILEDVIKSAFNKKLYLLGREFAQAHNMQLYTAEAFRLAADNPLMVSNEADGRQISGAIDGIIPSDDTFSNINREKAKEIFQKELDDGNTKALRGMGLLLVAEGKKEEGVILLKDYLLEYYNAHDKRYINSIIKSTQ